MKIKVKKKAPQGAFGYYLYFFYSWSSKTRFGLSLSNKPNVIQ